MDFFSMSHEAVPAVSRGRRLDDQKFQMFGRHYVEHWRNGLLIAEYDVHNDITNEGKNTIFDVMFSDLTPIAAASWYIGLISLTGFSALAAADTMSSHAGWTEFTTYSQANRVGWGPGNPASQSITNATPATFDMTGSGTVKGIFVTSNNTKGGTSGILWSTALFSADVPVVNGDQLKITYTINA
jgi:hypothetical protein